MTRDEMLRLFPELNEIKDQALRELSVDAFLLAFDRGGWNAENIAMAPVTLNWDCSCNLVEHIRTVTQACMAQFDLLEKFYKANGVVFERDIVVSGALLHDLGKFTEFALKDGKVVHSDNSFLMRHPLAGAIMAAETGLPDKIVHLIATHSFEGDKSNQTAESYFVRTIDDFVFKCTVFGLRKKG